MTERIKFDHGGIGDVLKSGEVHRAIEALTKRVAENVEALGIAVGDRDGGSSEYPLPVKSDVITTDRAHGRVVLAHPAGIAVQAKHGALTKAASQAGLEVR